MAFGKYYIITISTIFEDNWFLLFTIHLKTDGFTTIITEANRNGNTIPLYNTTLEIEEQQVWRKTTKIYFASILIKNNKI